MWFKLVNANFGDNSLGKMDVLADAWNVTYSMSGGITKTSGSGSVSKGGTLTATFTLSTGASFTNATLTPASAGTVTHSVSSSTVTVTIANVSANCTLSVVATGGSSSGGGGGITNYALPYTSWNWVSGFGDALTRTADSFSWSGIASGTSVVLGHKYALSDTPFKIGDTIYFGIRNLVKEGGNFSLCFFNADGTEITPRLNGTITSPISYLTKEVPAETARIEIRLHGSAMPSCSGGKAYLSTVPFDENTVWAN